MFVHTEEGLNVSQPQGPSAPGSAPSARTGRRAAVIVVVLAVVAALVVGGLALAGVFSSDDGADHDQTSEASTSASATPQEPEVVPGKTIGTPEKPYAPGDSFVFLEDWTFTLGATDFDTWPDVEADLQARLPTMMDSFLPEPGMVFVSAPLSMTYTGPPTYQGRITSVYAQYVTVDGTELFTGNCGRYGDAVAPFDESDALEMASVAGAVCVEMTPEQAIGGQWRIEVDYVDGDSDVLFRHIYYTAA